MIIHQLNSTKDLNGLQSGAVVESRNPELLRKACERAKIFINPLQAGPFYRDEALVRSVGGSQSSFAMPIAVLLKAKGGSRAKLFREIRFFIRLCLKLKAKFIFTNAFAQDKFDLKSAREMQAIATLFGLTPLQAKNATKTSFN
ncbi:TPA: hypothetical protein HA244_01910 [Candidatus Micrarchaeota archaeon]|nr:hypothetical protein [Candidatus Micrarchaeota archaeon]